MQGDGGDDHHVVALQQALRGRVAHAVDRPRDLAVLLHVGVGARDVGFRLVVVVVADEILPRRCPGRTASSLRIAGPPASCSAARISVGRCACSISLAMVNVLPEPVTPSSTGRARPSGCRPTGRGSRWAGRRRARTRSSPSAAGVSGLAGCRCGLKVTVPTSAARLAAPRALPDGRASGLTMTSDIRHSLCVGARDGNGRARRRACLCRRRMHPAPHAARLMLFYEPLFLFLFFPAVLAAFVLLRRRAGGRAGVLLAASLLFYLWSEPLFVPVVLATCVADYLLALLVARGSRAALAAGVLVNLGCWRTTNTPALPSITWMSCWSRRDGGRGMSGRSPCRSACHSSCSRRSPTWSISPAAAAARRRASPVTCCTSSCFPKLLAGRSSSITSWRRSCWPPAASEWTIWRKDSAASCSAW